MSSASVTVYWLSSSGQGPSLQVYGLPSQLVGFIRLAAADPHSAPWNRLVARGWDEEASRASKPLTKAAGLRLVGAGVSRNPVYNDLFRIFESGQADPRAARAFLRRHVLSKLKHSIANAADCDWSLAELFLREVLGMDQKTIEAIRDFSDRLAKHIQARNDKGLFRSIVYAKRPWELRAALTKAQRNEHMKNGALLFGLEEYLAVFEASDSVGASDWSLTRDLISIRLVENLHALNALSSDMLIDESATTTEDDTVTETV